MSNVPNSSLPFSDNAPDGTVVTAAEWNQMVQVLQAAINDNYSLIQKLNPDQAIPSMSAAPTSNSWTLGQIVWNSNPVPGGNLGWVCTTAGTPGTWKPFGLISTV